jgi:hypothetical protein
MKWDASLVILLFIFLQQDNNCSSSSNNVRIIIHSVMQLQLVSSGHALYLVGLGVFSRLNLTMSLKLPVDKLSFFLLAVEAGHRNNPFHNSERSALSSFF